MSDGGGDTDIGTADTMRERSGENRLKLWFLLRTSRFTLTAVLALVVFVGFMLFSVVLAPSLQAEIQKADTIETLFSSMITIVVTGTTLVVSISQLILSQENGPLGDQHERMIGAMDFRTYAKELVGSTVQSEPALFLRQIVEETKRRSETLDRRITGSDDPDLQRQVSEFVDSLRGNAETVTRQLDGAQFGTFDALFAALNYNYSSKIYQVERMSDEFADGLSEDQRTALDDLKTALVMFGPAREHIKTLYFQWELINLSQYILYAAIPAAIIAGGMLTFVGAETFGGTLLAIPTVTWVVGVAFTATLVPFLLFISYILRIVTIAKRTLAIEPLILRDSD